LNVSSPVRFLAAVVMLVVAIAVAYNANVWIFEKTRFFGFLVPWARILTVSIWSVVIAAALYAVVLRVALGKSLDSLSAATYGAQGALVAPALALLLVAVAVPSAHSTISSTASSSPSDVTAGIALVMTQLKAANLRALEASVLSRLLAVVLAIVWCRIVLARIEPRSPDAIGATVSVAIVAAIFV
jgi:hypothetical protein